MKLVRFTPPQKKYIRRLRPQDLERMRIPHVLGVDLVWDAGNQYTVEMSDEASDLLVAALPKQFRVVETEASGDDADPDSTDTPDASSASGSVENSTGSEGDSGLSVASSSSLLDSQP